ncbi:hypothetical protein CDN99_09635 [Roseateles aquatilis]|uniref:Uncharacterized protein n=1 Tax=Roseateles aquatilis TaxID=431061 RepID=A0A246JFL6_9BURK|nr:hypothetical protein [Roseateles aquatilis]OWQ91409.1 hypothetical protein CDN99_09635 [Roseateles aquatilis]
MKRSTHTMPAPRPRGEWASCMWVLRLMLVLVLITDQVGAPLHQHHHDSGVDALWSRATAYSHDDDLTVHAEESERPSTLGHATLAVRPAGETASVAVVADPARDFATVAYISGLWAALALVAQADDSGVGPDFPSWRSPPLPSYRSLPPAGRAPPLHA